MMNLLVIASPSSDYDAMEPQMIENAQNRIQRDLDLINTVVRDATITTTPGIRTVSIPAGFVVVEAVNIVSPPGSAPDAGVRVPLTPVSRAYLDTVWSSTAGSGIPAVFCSLDGISILVGPAPSAAYAVEFIGTRRIDVLSSVVTTNFISENLPDLLIAASMIYGSGWKQNYGAQADNAGEAMSWTTVYKDLLANATVEEFRKKFQSWGWTAQSPSPVAVPRT